MDDVGVPLFEETTKYDVVYWLVFLEILEVFIGF